jgi:hypothetical protein
MFTTHFRGGFVEHISQTQVTQQSVTKMKYLLFINLVATKARAKHEPLFNEPASSLLNNCSCLAQALDVTKFTTV